MIYVITYVYIYIYIRVYVYVYVSVYVFVNVYLLYVYVHMRYVSFPNHATPNHPGEYTITLTGLETHGDDWGSHFETPPCTFQHISYFCKDH